MLYCWRSVDWLIISTIKSLLYVQAHAFRNAVVAAKMQSYIICPNPLYFPALSPLIRLVKDHSNTLSKLALSLVSSFAKS